MAKMNGDEGIIISPEGRMIFPDMFDPKRFGERQGKPQGDPMFGGLFAFERADVGDLVKKAQAVAMKYWDGNLPSNIRWPFEKGDEYAAKQKAKGKDGSFAEGKTLVKGKSKYKPGLIDWLGNEIVDPNKAYSGCYVRCEFNLVAYDAIGEDGRPGVKAYLNHVMLSRRQANHETAGERIGGADAKSVFSGLIDQDSTGVDSAGPGNDLDDEIPF